MNPTSSTNPTTPFVCSAPGEQALQQLADKLFGPECQPDQKEKLMSAITKCFTERPNKGGFAPMCNTIDDISSPIPYASNTKLVNVAPHIGQLKLCLSEMEFISSAVSYVRSYQAYNKLQNEQTRDPLRALAERFRLSAVCKLLGIAEPRGHCEVPDTPVVAFPTPPLPHPTSDRMYVIYAGAAPCEHMYQLMLHLPPEVILILVDPNQFNCIVVPAEKPEDRRSYRQYACEPIAHIVENSKVKEKYKYNGKNFGGVRNSEGGASKLKSGGWVDFITDPKNTEVRMFLIESFMDEAAAKALSKLHKFGTVVYMSDIRTNRNENRTTKQTQRKPQRPAEDDDNPTNIDIVFNNCLEVVIRAHLKPSMIMLKFRQFFLDPKSRAAVGKPLGADEIGIMQAAKDLGVDVAGHYYSKTLTQLVPSGAIHLQCFAGKSSSETRLITGSSRYVLLDIEDYENRCYTYNNVNRLFACVRPHVSSADLSKCAGYDLTNDCSRAIAIFANFKHVFNSAISLVDLVNEASVFTKVPAQRSPRFGALTQEIALSDYIDHLTLPVDNDVYKRCTAKFQSFWNVKCARYNNIIWPLVHQRIEIVFDNTVNTTTQTNTGHTNVYGKRNQVKA